MEAPDYPHVMEINLPDKDAMLGVDSIPPHRVPEKDSGEANTYNHVQRFVPKLIFVNERASNIVPKDGFVVIL